MVCSAGFFDAQVPKLFLAGGRTLRTHSFANFKFLDLSLEFLSAFVLLWPIHSTKLVCYLRLVIIAVFFNFVLSCTGRTPVFWWRKRIARLHFKQRSLLLKRVYKGLGRFSPCLFKGIDERCCCSRNGWWKGCGLVEVLVLIAICLLF